MKPSTSRSGCHSRASWVARTSSCSSGWIWSSAILEVKQADTYAAQQARLDRLTTEAEIEAELAPVRAAWPIAQGNPQSRDELDQQCASVWSGSTPGDYDRVPAVVAPAGPSGSRQATLRRSLRPCSTWRASSSDARNRTGDRQHQSHPARRRQRNELGAAGRRRSCLPIDRAEVLRERRRDPQRAAHDSFYLNGVPPSGRLSCSGWRSPTGARNRWTFDGLTIEHVLPQTLLDWWRVLGEDLSRTRTSKSMRGSCAHPGQPDPDRLQLQAEQQLLPGEAPPTGKSGLSMNQEIAGPTRWGRQEILSLGRQLAERDLDPLWPHRRRRWADPASPGT